MPRKMELTEAIKWKIITNKNIGEQLPTDEDWAIWVLDAKGYENVSTNEAIKIRWICEATWQLLYYREELDPKTLKGLQDLCGKQ